MSYEYFTKLRDLLYEIDRKLSALGESQPEEKKAISHPPEKPKEYEQPIMTFIHNKPKECDHEWVRGEEFGHGYTNNVLVCRKCEVWKQKKTKPSLPCKLSFEQANIYTNQALVQTINQLIDYLKAKEEV